MRRRLIARGLLLFLALCVSAVVCLLGWRAWRQQEIRRQTAITSPDGIASIEKVPLGGVDQWIQIRGQHRGNPVVLVLHGGPGLPEMPYEFVNAELEKHFVMVQWDQPGAGKSFTSKKAIKSVTLEQIVGDAGELVDLLRKRFGQARVILVGHSTGTIIGVMLAAQQPETVRAYVGISQIVDLHESEKILYQFARQAAVKKHEADALRELKEIGPPPFSNVHQLQTSQKWVNHFAPDRYGALAPARLELTFISPAYGLMDLARFVFGAKDSFEQLWREFFAVDLFRQVPRLNVPVYFFEGRDDHVVTAQGAQQYFDALAAPRGKKLIWFEHSAHWPQLEEPKKFQEEMERVLTETDP